MAQDQEWKESSGNFWKPEKDGDEILGLLLAVQQNVGQNSSTMYTIEEKETREMVNVWGSTVLDSRMKGIKIGQEVRIVYKGLGDKSPGKNPPKIFQVFYRDPAGETGDDIAF